MNLKKQLQKTLITSLFFVSSALWAQHKIEIGNITAAPGDTIEVPVLLSSDLGIAFIQITVEYDSSQLELVPPHVLQGAGAGGLQLGVINTNFNKEPESPTANTQVLFQLSGGGTQSITGENLEIAKLVFVKTDSIGSSSIHPDTRAAHSFLTTTDLVDLYGSQIDFIDGEVSMSDRVSPICQITFPKDSSEHNIGLIIVTGSAADFGGSGVDTVEISLDGGVSWQAVMPVNGTFEQWQYDWLPTAPGDYILVARATDKELNVGYSFPPLQLRVLSPPMELFLPSNNQAQIGARIDIPVLLNNAENVSFIQTTVEWDTSALKLRDVLIGSSASGFSISQINRDLPFETTSGLTNDNVLFQVTGDGIAALSGSSLEIAILQFEAVGLADSITPVLFDSLCTHTYISTADLQDICSPVMELIDGKVLMIAKDKIDGHVTYYASNQPVGDVLVSISGPEFRTVQTDQTGGYLIDELIRGQYTIAPQKTGEINDAITASDALAIMQTVAFVRQLTAVQILAADVDKNGLLSGADAVAVLRHVAYFEAGTMATGQWGFDPANKVIDLESLYTQDFSAYILGDVTGNWHNSGLPKIAKIQALAIHPAIDGDGKINLSLNVAQKVAGLNSLCLSLNWHGTPPLSVAFAPAKQQSFVLNNMDANQTHIAIACIAGFSAGEKIGEFVLETASQPQMGQNIATAAKITVEDSVAPDFSIVMQPTSIENENENQSPETLRLYHNYPNPFNMETIIRFDLPEKLNGAQVTLAIYNFNGQKIKLLYSGIASAGVQTVKWDGTDETGAVVSSGTYLYRFQAGENVKTAKLTLLK